MNVWSFPFVLSHRRSEAASVLPFPFVTGSSSTYDSVSRGIPRREMSHPIKRVSGVGSDEEDTAGSEWQDF